MSGRDHFILFLFGFAMLLVLGMLSDAVRQELATYRGISSAPTCDLYALSQCRWHMAQASNRRMKHIFDVVIPAVASCKNDRVMAGLSDLQGAFQDRRRRISAHIANWPLDMVAANWRDYCSATKSVREEMEQWLVDEDHRMAELVAAMQARNSPTPPGPVKA